MLFYYTAKSVYIYKNWIVAQRTQYLISKVYSYTATPFRDHESIVPTGTAVPLLGIISL
jgi:hypothetical protein